MSGSSAWSNVLRRGAWLSLLLLPAGVATAQDMDGWPESVQLHGFLSQGFVQSSDNRFFGPSDEGSWDFREIGINLSYQPRPDLLISGQLLSRTAGEMYDSSVRLDYGLIDFAPIMASDTRAGLRVGRLKNPLGFYNDTRDVPFTRPSIFLPQSIYFDRVRNLELSAEGVGIYGDWQARAGDFYLQLNAGQLNIDENVEYAYLLGDYPGKLTTRDPWVVGRLRYESGGGLLRLAYSRAVGTMEYQPGRGDYLSAGDIDVDFWIVSAQLNSEDWSFTAEFMREPVDMNGFGIPGVDRKQTVEGYYLQGVYRVSADWELMARYDVSYVDNNDKDGIRQAANSGLPAHNFFAKDLTLGARWDVTSRFMLRMEYHLVNGTSWLSTRENDFLNTEKTWDMVVLQASFRF